MISANLFLYQKTPAVIKKAQQLLRFLRVLRKNNILEKLVTFYCSTTYCITLWFSSCTEADRERLQRVVKTAQKIIACPLPSLKDLDTSRCLIRTEAITRDRTHPAHQLFDYDQAEIASLHKPSLHLTKAGNTMELCPSFTWVGCPLLGSCGGYGNSCGVHCNGKLLLYH